MVFYEKRLHKNMNTVNQSTICNKNTHRNCENYRNHCYNLQLPLQLLFALMHGRPILTWIIFKLYSANKPKLFCCCFFLLLLFILHVKIQRRLVRWMSTQQLFSVCAQRCLGSWEENTECMRCTALTAVYFLYTSVGCEWRVAFALRYMLLVVVVVVVFFFALYENTGSAYKPKRIWNFSYHQPKSKRSTFDSEASLGALIHVACIQWRFVSLCEDGEAWFSVQWLLSGWKSKHVLDDMRTFATLEYY